MMTTLIKPSDDAKDDSSSLEHNKTPQRVMVHAYYRDKDVYVISSMLHDATTKTQPPTDAAATDVSTLRRSSALVLSETTASAATATTAAVVPDDNWQWVASSQLHPASSATFYPVLETLLARAEQTADAAKQFLASDTTKRLVQHTDQVLQRQVNKITQQQNQQKKDSSLLADLANSNEIVQKVHEAKWDEQAQQVLKIVKDEQITTLLEKCRTRLEQLVHLPLTETTRKALERTGIRIDETDSLSTSMAESMRTSRQAALRALEDFLKEAQIEADPEILKKTSARLSQDFATAFDTLATAAKSDPDLHAAYEAVAEKTSEWQEATGRLLATRSASLFLEGASRLQARATAIFKANQLEWAGEIGSKLTKSFTEGDAALARLKSIELGDAVKNRLIAAIEVRSESLGGLDGIIAGALTTIKSNGSNDQMKSMLNGLQQRATSATASAHETLLSVLSSRSQYRDVALLRIENTLCSLQDQFGAESLDPAEIAKIARGEGGTAKIFEPIAKRAMKEIEHQLDLAQANITDKTALHVLERVRKIMSGDLTLSAVMDEVIGVLNDERVVAAGETIVQHSEQFLDAIEGASSNKAVSDALKLAEKAGITKDSVMRELQKLDVNDLLDTAGSAVTDEKARRKLVSSATDLALDFVLRILPSMPVPPLEGVKDGLIYRISNLSMEGFRVKKEDIQILLAGMRATRRAVPPVATEDPATNEGIRSIDSQDSLQVEDMQLPVKATELLIIDIQRISAILDGAAWSFEQTYLPYLKGNGLANVKLHGGSIRLQFELRKRLKEDKKDDDADAWEPVLCLHDRSCAIAEVELTMQGEGTMAWIFNKLASIFKGALRDYVVRTIVRVLANQSGWILSRLNGILGPYWDLILRTAKLNMVSHLL